MKKIISILGALAIMSAVAFAQPKAKGEKECKDDGQWRERVRAEQVGFISSELELTEAEAQKFWPVYNDVQEKRREAFKEMKIHYNALEKAKGGADVSSELDSYLEAKMKCNQVENDGIKRYRAVLSKEKVAKLIVAEEKFRHRQIGKLRGHGGKHRPGSGSEE